MPGPRVLVLNAGSSSLKLGLFEGETRIAKGLIDRIGAGGAAGALEAALEKLGPHGGLAGVVAVGHRIVHGGAEFVGATRLDGPALDRLHGLEPLDPNHLPAELGIVRAVAARAPHLAQVACFDTAFHASLPRVARLLGIPRRFEASGIRRYGFHGLSYQFQLEELERVAGPAAARGRVGMAHLGS